MRTIYKYDVIEELDKGNEVYAVILGGQKPMVENAGTVSGRVLARYMNMDNIDWYVSEEKDEQNP